MALSTSRVSPPPETAAEPFGLEALERFYRLHARIYDVTRPFILFGRGAAADALQAAPGQLVLDVGCGTGINLPRLAATGASVVGIESSSAMRAQAERRLLRRAEAERWRVRLDPRAYGTHRDYAGQVDGVLFSYSLSMIPPFEAVLARAHADLRDGGRISVVDFLDAPFAVAQALERSHVWLGAKRLEELQRLCPRHDVRIRSAGLWRYYLFRGEKR